MNSLKIERLNKSYGNSKILNNISMEIREGEMVSLLGPSGCGKSTLLKIISGLEVMDSGSIYYKGVNWNNLTTQKRNVGMVFQNYSLFPNMTAMQNVSFGLEMKGMSKKSANFETLNWLEKVGLKELADRYSYQLSGGQQQRVALVRALAPKPNVLLLDEPLSALDAAIRENLRNEIRTLQKQLDITAIFVTHDQREALAISDKIALMEKGVILEYEEPKTLYSNPKNIFTAKFLGDSSRIEGIVENADTLSVRTGIHNIHISEKYKGKFKNGEKVIMFIHSEDASFEENTKVSDVNRLYGKITGRTYLGNRVRYEVKIDEQNSMSVDVAREDNLYTEGMKINIYLNSSDIHAFAA